MKIPFFLMACVLLAGCGESEPDAQAVKMFGKTCESLGHAPGSREFNACVTNIAEKK